MYVDIFTKWKTHVSETPKTPTCLLSQFLWFSNYIQIGGNPLHLKNFAAKNINFLTQLFEEGNLKPGDDLKLESNLTNETYFQWLQLKQIIPRKREINIRQNSGNVSNILIQDHHFIKGGPILTLEKLSSKEVIQYLHRIYK